MKRVDLITIMAEEAHISRAKAELALSAFVRGVQAGLKRREKVALRGFGSFSIQDREGRECRDPRNGAPVRSKKTVTVRFTAGRHFKEGVR